MRIGALAKKTGLSRDTIRFYERHGLIHSHASTDPANSYRDYPDEMVEQLEMIGAAREAGLSVADLASLIITLSGDGHGSFDADEFLDTKIAEVRQTIAASRKFLSFLEATKKALGDGPLEWR